MILTLRTISLVGVLIGITAALQCQKCNLTTTVVTPPDSSRELKKIGNHICSEVTCEEDADVCRSGYATLAFSGPSKPAELELPELAELELLQLMLYETGKVMVKWFKDCGVQAESTCSHLMTSLRYHVDKDIQNVTFTVCQMYLRVGVLLLTFENLHNNLINIEDHLSISLIFRSRRKSATSKRVPRTTAMT